MEAFKETVLALGISGCNVAGSNVDSDDSATTGRSLYRTYVEVPMEAFWEPSLTAMAICLVMALATWDPFVASAR
jgi:hypothetical protein